MSDSILTILCHQILVIGSYPQADGTCLLELDMPVSVQEAIAEHGKSTNQSTGEILGDWLQLGHEAMIKEGQAGRQAEGGENK